MTKILDIRNEIIEIEARRVSSELLENRIGYRVLAGPCFPHCFNEGVSSVIIFRLEEPFAEKNKINSISTPFYHPIRGKIRITVPSRYFSQYFSEFPAVNMLILP